MSDILKQTQQITALKAIAKNEDAKLKAELTDLENKRDELIESLANTQLKIRNVKADKAFVDRALSNFNNVQNGCDRGQADGAKDIKL